MLARGGRLDTLGDEHAGTVKVASHPVVEDSRDRHASSVQGAKRFIIVPEVHSDADRVHGAKRVEVFSGEEDRAVLVVCVDHALGQDISPVIDLGSAQEHDQRRRFGERAFRRAMGFLGLRLARRQQPHRQSDQNERQQPHADRGPHSVRSNQSRGVVVDSRRLKP